MVDEKNHQVKLTIKNLDYRINKKKRTKIVETKHAFSTLKENLPLCITKKIDDIDRKN